MSREASFWAGETKVGNVARKAVLWALAYRCDQWGWSYPGQVLIAEETELSERAVRRLLNELADRGVIEIWQSKKGKVGTWNIYRLCFQATPKDPIPPHHPSQNKKFAFYLKRNRGEKVVDQAAETLSDESRPADSLAGGQGRPADSLAGGPADSLAGGPDRPPDSGGTTTGLSAHDHRTPESAEYLEKESEGSAAGAGGDPDGPPAPCVEGETPSLAEYWRQHCKILGETIGGGLRVWLLDTILAEDEDRRLVVWTPSRSAADQLNQTWAPRILRVLGKDAIEFVYDDRAAGARARRKEREKLEAEGD